MSADQLRQLLERIEQYERDKSFAPVLERAEARALERRFTGDPVTAFGGL